MSNPIGFLSKRSWLEKDHFRPCPLANTIKTRHKRANNLMGYIMRADGRKNSDLRPIKMEIGYLKHHEGSVMITAGNTKILTLVTSENRVPPHRYEVGGWLSA